MNGFTIKSIASAQKGCMVRLIPNIVDEDVNNEALIVEEQVIAWALVVRENGREVIEPVFLNEDYMPITYSQWEQDEQEINSLADPIYEVFRNESIR